MTTPHSAFNLGWLFRPCLGQRCLGFGVIGLIGFDGVLTLGFRVQGLSGLGYRVYSQGLVLRGLSSLDLQPVAAVRLCFVLLSY